MTQPSFSPQSGNGAVYAGLRAIWQGEFPRICPRCHTRHETFEDFLAQTSPPPASTGLMAYENSDRAKQVGLSRNCSCGSTLTIFCFDRRDESETGTKRRRIFDSLLERLRDMEISTERARTEILRVLRGGRSEILDGIFQRENNAGG